MLLVLKIMVFKFIYYIVRWLGPLSVELRNMIGQFDWSVAFFP